MSDKKKTIDAVWLYVCEDEEGEGVPAQQVGDMLMPLLGADEERVKSMRPMAQNIAAQEGIQVKLVKFTQREELETVKPKASSKPSISVEEIMAYREKAREQSVMITSEIIDDPKYAKGVWNKQEDEDWEFIVGRECVIFLSPRLAHCDRGNWLAQLDAIGKLGRDLNDADLWPRFYMDYERAKLEVVAWMTKRGQLVI